MAVVGVAHHPNLVVKIDILRWDNTNLIQTFIIIYLYLEPYKNVTLKFKISSLAFHTYDYIYKLENLDCPFICLLFIFLELFEVKNKFL